MNDDRSFPYTYIDPFSCFLVLSCSQNFFVAKLRDAGWTAPDPTY